MWIIAIANEKGGVAKTTTTLSLGGALVEAGKEVLLIDLDAQANLSLGLGVTPADLRHSIADVMLNSESLLSVSRETAVPGLELVPANADIALAERFLPMRRSYEYILKNALSRVNRYDYVLLDCPPSLGAVTWNALTAAHYVIAPTQPEYFSAHGLKNVMATIRQVRQQTNAGLIYFILVTMMDRRNRIHRTLIEHLRTTFGEGLINTVIEVDTKLRESILAGLPITHYIKNSRGALQYRALAQELIQYVEEKTAQPN